MAEATATEIEKANASKGEAPIGFTEYALKKLHELEQEKTGEAHLRVGVQGGGCSGLSYQLEFETGELGPKDKTFEYDGITVVSDIKSLLYLRGLVVDFSTDLVGGGFKFKNPNATSTCGCGTSFAV